jgi:predicted PurR-regulated permease PerM
MGLQQAALWGLLAGILNSIPYYGPLLVTAGLALVGFLQFGTIAMTIAVAGVSLLITTLEGSLFTPMLMGRAASMNQWPCSSACCSGAGSGASGACCSRYR